MQETFRRARSGRERAQFGRNPHFDWLVLCLSFVVLLLCAVTGSVILYQRIDQDSLFLAKKEESALFRPIDTRKLERTIRYFEKKNEEFNALLYRSLPAEDPYIPEAQAK
jgi:hypothetical protein